MQNRPRRIDRLPAAGQPAGPIAMRSPQPGQNAEPGASVIEQRGQDDE